MAAAEDDAPAILSAVDYAEAVAEEIHLIRRLYQTHIGRAYASAQRDMVYMAGRILDFVAKRPGCVQADIASYFHRDKGQIAKVVASLREQGLITLEAEASDRRRQRIALTKEGQTVRLQSQEKREHVAKLGVAGLSAAERRQLLELLGRMRDNLESEPV